MTWSGSAFLGGVLSDAKDYRFPSSTQQHSASPGAFETAGDTWSRYTFFITALVYASACLVYVPLLYLVPRKEKEAASVAASGWTVMHGEELFDAPR